MVEEPGHGQVIDLRTARGYRLDVASIARSRFATARRESGLSRAAFAEALMETLGWPVSPEATTAWESAGVPPGDVLLAAELLVPPRNRATASGVETTLAVADAHMHLVDTYAQVQAALSAVIDTATEVLATTGSRSRDPDYLARIEKAVTERPSLVHYRVLYGPPRHGALKNHLLRLVDLHRQEGTTNIGIIRDLYQDAERFLCVSERAAVIVLPSATSVSNFDTALVINDADTARNYLAHIRQAHLGSETLTTRTMVENLEVLR